MKAREWAKRGLIIFFIILSIKNIYSESKVIYILPSIYETNSNTNLLNEFKNRVKLFLFQTEEFKIIEDLEIASLIPKAVTVINKFKKERDKRLLEKIIPALKFEKSIIFEITNQKLNITLYQFEKGEVKKFKILEGAELNLSKFGELEYEIAKKILNPDYEIHLSKKIEFSRLLDKKYEKFGFYSFITNGYKAFLGYDFDKSIDFYNKCEELFKKAGNTQELKELDYLSRLTTTIAYNYIENRIWLYYKKAELKIKENESGEAKEILKRMRDIFKNKKFLSYNSFYFYNKLALFLKEAEIEIGKIYGTDESDELILLKEFINDKIIIAGRVLKGPKLFFKILNLKGEELSSEELFLENTVINSVALFSTNYFILGGYRWESGRERDAYVAKFDLKFKKLWEKSTGGKYFDGINKIVSIDDGSILAIGSSASFGNGGLDVYLLFFDSDGNLKWQRTFGGKEYDNGIDGFEVSDNSFIIYAITKSFGKGAEDLMILKIDKNGNPLWYEIK